VRGKGTSSGRGKSKKISVPRSRTAARPLVAVGFRRKIPLLLHTEKTRKTRTGPAKNWETGLSSRGAPGPYK